ncbi:Kinase non-catalytic C-lobe domain-containing protein 1, partial [Saguinus oedipus]
RPDTATHSPAVTATILSPPTQASVYCVAAVLWTAAKFSIPRNQKLALPRRLKALLLDMAKRSAPERLSTAEAIKVTTPWSWPGPG